MSRSWCETDLAKKGRQQPQPWHCSLFSSQPYLEKQRSARDLRRFAYQRGSARGDPLLGLLLDPRIYQLVEDILRVLHACSCRAQ